MFSECVHLGRPGIVTRQQQREETLYNVLKAAERLFVTRGFSATTIRDIAADAGVSVGTVMSVGDKHALLVKVFEKYIADEHQQATRISGIPAGGTAQQQVDALVELVTPFVELFLARYELAQHYASMLVGGGQPSNLFQELGDTLVQEFSQVIGASQGELKGRALYCAYVGVLFMASAQGTSDSAGIFSELRQVFSSIVDS